MKPTSPSPEQHTLNQGSVAELLRDSLAKASVTERRVAHALLADYPLLALGTLAEWAGIAHVSTPSILRFLTKLGFASYPDFQAILRGELALRLSSPLDKHPKNVDSDSCQSLEFAKSVCDNINQTFNHLALSEIVAVTALICDQKRKLALVGGRFTDPLARYATAHLTILRTGVFGLLGQTDNWRDKLLDLGKGDILIIFDIRRYTPELLRLAQQAHERKMTIILVTDQWLSPIAKVASHILPARISVPSRWDSNAAIMTIIEMLLDAVTTKLGAKADQRIQQLEDLRKD